jgi:acylpyruvate hydrolase
MQLVSFLSNSEAAARVGALIRQPHQSYIVDLNHAAADIPAQMIAFLDAGETALEMARRVLDFPPGRALIPIEAVTLLAPVPRPGKIICLGHNYSDHIGIGRTAPAEYPNFFDKTANTVTGPGMSIIIPPVTQQVEYEAELAVVIGKRAYRVEQENAYDYVAGYTIFNDVSARDYQKRTSQWMLGKCFDTFGPMGPALVTTDEIPDPHDLDLSLTLNGQELQRAHTGNMIFTIPYMIAYLTAVMTLEPGDLISTGTPAKTELAQTLPPFMHPGDEVRIQISKIGELVNPIAAG